MDENTKKLLDEFKRIAEKGWIKSVSKSTGSIGITFEKELGRNENSSFLPDYYDIEIKCSSKYSRYPMTLFSSTFDGPSDGELKRITNLYGYYDKVYNDKKILYSSLSCKTKYLVNKKYYFQLQMDYQEEKLYLLVYDKNNVLLERISFIYFKTLFKHLNIKFKKLAVIYGKSTKKKNETYFNYYQINIYKLRDYKKFLELLQENVICIDLISRVNKSLNNGGKYKNKNLTFTIKRENLGKLFEKVYSYNSQI